MSARVYLYSVVFVALGVAKCLFVNVNLSRVFHWNYILFKKR